MRALRWTEHAVAQLATVAEYVSLSSPVYAEHLVDQIARRLDQARECPESGRVVPEFARQDVRELIEWPYRLVYCVHADAIDRLGSPRPSGAARAAVGGHLTAANVR